ncbi:MAG: type II toxin-antitoxin system RelE/ParE family toxin [Patescibacteria group bacterium]
MKKVLLKKRAEKDLLKLEKGVRDRVTKKLIDLGIDPLIGKALQGEYSGYFSLRSWPYRIIYRIGKNEITIHTIKHRQGSYK